MKNSIFKLMMATAILLGASNEAQAEVPVKPDITTENDRLFCNVGEYITFTFASSTVYWDWELTTTVLGLSQTPAAYGATKKTNSVSGLPTATGVYTITARVYADNGTASTTGTARGTLYTERVFQVIVLSKPVNDQLSWVAKPAPNYLVYGAPEQEMYARTNSNAVITYSSFPAGIAEVVPNSGNTPRTLKITGAGTVTIRATIPSNNEYGMAFIDTVLDIKPATITHVEGIKVDNKVYDGSDSAHIVTPLSGLSFTKLEGTDVLTLNTTAAKAQFLNKTTGNPTKDVGFWDIKLSGFELADVPGSTPVAKNYVLSPSVQFIADKATIGKRSVIIENLRVEDKVYDGNEKVAVTSIDTSAARIVPFFDGNIHGMDAATPWIKMGSAIFGTSSSPVNQADLTTSPPVTFSGFDLGDALKQNYYLSRDPVKESDDYPRILPKSLYIDTLNLQVEDKVFDGYSIAKYMWEPKLIKSDIVGLDDVKLLSTSGTPIFTSVVVDTVDTNPHEGSRPMPISVQRSLFQLDGAQKSNYVLVDTVISPRLMATIIPADIRIKGLTASPKVYDGTDSAHVVGPAVFVSADDSEVLTYALNRFHPELIYGLAKFAHKDAGGEQNVTFEGFSIEGEYAKNYNLIGQPGDTASIITPKPVYVAGATVRERPYSGDRIANIDALSIGGFADPDTASYRQAKPWAYDNIGEFLTKNAGTGKGVHIKDIMLTGVAASGNYSLASDIDTVYTGVITKQGISVDRAYVQDTVYNGSRLARVDSIDFKNLVSGEKLKFNTDYSITGSSLFASKDVGDNIEVDITGIQLLRTDIADNYSIEERNSSHTTYANITQRPITIKKASSEVTKVYDGKKDVSVAPVALEFNNLANGDELVKGIHYTFNTTGYFDSIHVLRADSVNIQGISLLNSTDNVKAARNYKLAETTFSGVHGTITKKKIDFIDADIQRKEYDGTESAVIRSLKFDSLVVGDFLVKDKDYEVTSALFRDKDAGDNKPVSITGIKLLPSLEAGNYRLDRNYYEGKGNIEKVLLSVDSAIILSRVYDGTTDAIVEGLTFKGFITPPGTTTMEAFALADYKFSSQGTFDTKNVGKGKGVTVKDIILVPDGPTAKNYKLKQSTYVSRSGVIEKRPLSITGAKVKVRDYDATTNAEIEDILFDGLVSGETLTKSNDYDFRRIGTFDSPKAKDNKEVSITGITLYNSLKAKNYEFIDNDEDGDAKISTFTTNTGKINKRVLSVDKASVKSKFYDGTSSAIVNSITFKGFPSTAEMFDFTESEYTFSEEGDFVDASSGNNKDVVVHKVALTDYDSNYTLESSDQVGKTSANIREPKVTINSKTFSSHVKRSANSQVEEADYVVPCGAESVTVEVQYTDSVYVQDEKVNPFTINVKHPGIVKHYYEVLTDYGRTEYVFTTETRIPFDVLVEVKYHNTMIANNNFATNGGFNFIAYQWTKNGEDIEGATEQIYTTPIGQILDSKAEYGLTVWTDTHEVLRACPAKALTSQMIIQPSSLTVSPSPAEPDEILFVGGVPSKTRIVNVYDAGNGQLKSSTPIVYSTDLQEVTLRAPSTKGVYVIKAGDSTVKFIVK